MVECFLGKMQNCLVPGYLSYWVLSRFAPVVKDSAAGGYLHGTMTWSLVLESTVIEGTPIPLPFELTGEMWLVGARFAGIQLIPKRHYRILGDSKVSLACCMHEMNSMDLNVGGSFEIELGFARMHMALMLRKLSNVSA